MVLPGKFKLIHYIGSVQEVSYLMQPEMALCIIFGLSFVSLTQSLEWWKVQLGQSVTIQCDITYYRETTWVIHKSDQIPVVLLVAGPNHPDGSLYSKDHMSPRFQAVANQSREVNNLKISNVTKEDLALYYCMGRVNGKQMFGRGTRLYLDDAEGDDDILTTKVPFQTEEPRFNLYLLLAGLRAIGLLIFLSAILTVNIKSRKKIIHQVQTKEKRTFRTVQMS